MILKLDNDLDPSQYNSLLDVLAYISKTHGDRDAFSCFGRTLSYAQVDHYSDVFAAYLQQKTTLRPGDRIAIQLPNVLQFPIVLYGAIKAGLIVVNTNPLYTPREMRHQFVDSGVKAVVILANFCAKLQEVIADTDIKHVIVSELGDLQSPLKRTLINLVARYVKKMVPGYTLDATVSFHKLMSSKPVAEVRYSQRAGEDVALILYTGGTTGFAKGVMLTHRNLIANMMQLRSRCLSIIRDREDSIAAPLPLYHSYAFLFHCLVMPYAGNHNLLITNPRDLPSLLAIFKKYRVHGFIGLNTLFLAMLNHPDIKSVDFSAMRFTGAGGMPLTRNVAEGWEKLTGCSIFEGYGLTECSPVVSVNPPENNQPGTVGPPVPETEIKVMSDAGEELAAGEKGELWVRGPQVMKGYWQDEKSTNEVLTPDRWFKTGDYVQVLDNGYIKIVDRKKDMILVSGFNVIPGEIEEYVNTHPGVLESAAIGVPHAQTGEAVVLFLVAKDKSLGKEDLLAFCRKGLTAYKIPRTFVFAESLPKSNIGKVLRRELREQYKQSVEQISPS